MSAVIARDVLPETKPRAAVHKFGGSSLADAAAIRRAAAIVAAESSSPCYVVVSAAYGVTNDLIGCLDAAVAAGEWRRSLRRLRRRQGGLIRTLVPKGSGALLEADLRSDFRRLTQLLAAAELLRSASGEAADAVAAHGELWSMRLFSAVLREQGLAASTLDARRFLRVNESGGAYAVDWSASRTAFAAETRESAGVIVVPGFIASCAERDVTRTLGRNGSDWSATILARLADAASVTIWSDVPGVLDGDPAVVAGAATQARLGFDAARTLAAHGARILHPATLEPLDGLDTGLYVRCTFAPEAAETRLGAEAPAPPAMISATGDTVSVIGSTFAKADVFAALHTARVGFRDGEIASDRVSLRVAPADVMRAQRVLHRRLCRGRRRADVLLIGPGQVGTAFLKALAERGDDAVRLLGVANSKNFVHAAGGITPARVMRLLRASSLPSDPATFAECLLAHCEAPPVIVDATASEAVARRHARWLAAGIHVVTANKLAAAAGWVTAADRERAFYGDAATVGAGLPILRTLRRLRAAGDHIECVEGILSGSLAFLFHALERGRRFSAALAAARRAGYVEPDPRSDLSGLDVARKLAIIAEAAGISADITAPRPPIPAAALELDADSFRHELPALDANLRQAARAAKAEKSILRYVADLAADGTNNVAARAVPLGSPLAQTRGVENVAVIHSRAYDKQPLVIRGPGAGPDVTARALLADVAAVLARYG